MKKLDNWKSKLIVVFPLVFLLYCSMPTDSKVKLKANAGPDQATFVGSYVRLVPVEKWGPVPPDSYEWEEDRLNPDRMCVVWMSNSGVLELGFDTPGTYKFTLVVKNGEERSEPDEVVVTVEPNPSLAFEDPNLELAVRYHLKERTAPLTPARLAELDSLPSYTYNTDAIISLEGIEQCSNLTYLSMESQNLTDLSPISKLSTLRALNITSNQVIPDISPLSTLTNLEWLNLASNSITDIEPLKNLVKLTNLDLPANPIDDISPLGSLVNLRRLFLRGATVENLSSLANLKELTVLWLWDCGVTDISAVKDLANLGSLNLESNDISDISALAALTNLEYLRLEKNRVSDITTLQNLVNLKHVRLRDNQIQDIKPFVDNPGLGNGDYIELFSNPLSQESLEVYIPILIDRGCYVVW